MKEISKCVISFEKEYLSGAVIRRLTVTKREINIQTTYKNFVRCSKVYQKIFSYITDLCHYHDLVIYRDYGPCIIQYDKDKITWRYLDVMLNSQITNWITENKIVLSEHNHFEIPDEHKVEFKLRFM